MLQVVRRSCTEEDKVQTALHAAVRCRKTGYKSGKKGVKICHESGEVRENCDPKRKLGDSNEKM